MKTNGNIQPIALTFNLVNLGLYIGVYYLLRYVQIPLLFNKGKKVLFFFSIILSSILLILLWRCGLIFIEKQTGEKCGVLNMGIASYLIEVVQAYSPAVALLAWESFAERKNTLQLKNKLEKEKLANELSFLKAKINPHFLINTLNSLHSNVLAKEMDSGDMILNLSAILDYVLHKGNKESIPLKEEVLIIEKFLNLEQKRLGHKQRIVFSNHRNFTTNISPLSILSLIENVFKISNLSSKILNYKIEISELPSQIVGQILISPTKFAQADLAKISDSLVDYKRQMNLIYPTAYVLSITEEKEAYQILLELNPTL